MPLGSFTLHDQNFNTTSWCTWCFYRGNTHEYEWVCQYLSHLQDFSLHLVWVHFCITFCFLRSCGDQPDPLLLPQLPFCSISRLFWWSEGSCLLHLLSQTLLFKPELPGGYWLVFNNVLAAFSSSLQ